MPKPINEAASRKNRIKLTKRSVESLPSAATSVVWYDDKLAGFGVRVMPSGRRFYFARYRNKHGRSRWFTIGEHGKVTADAARTMAQRIPQTVAVDGSDPSSEREAFRAAPTVSDMLDRYLAEHVERRNRPSTRAFKSIVERDIRPELGHLKVASVTCQDMHRFHAARANTPRQANLILAVCSKAFGLAELWEMRRWQQSLFEDRALPRKPQRAVPFGRKARPPGQYAAASRGHRTAGPCGQTRGPPQTLQASYHRGGRASAIHRLPPLRGGEPALGAGGLHRWHHHTAGNEIRPSSGGGDERAGASSIATIADG